MLKYRYRSVSLLIILSLISLTGCGISTALPSHHSPSPSKTTHQSESTSSTNPVKNSSKPSQASSFPSTVRSQASAVRFNVAVIQAMTYLQHHKIHIPLMAPSVLGFNPPVSSLSAAARVTGGGTTYVVNLYATSKPLTLNSPVLSTLPMMDIIGSFSASQFPSPDSAKAHLYQSNPSTSLAPPYQPPPNVPASLVNLGYGITGTLYNNAALSMAMWHEGEWTFQVWDGTPTQDRQQAMKFVAYLHTHLLPETYGVLGENLAGDGNHTTAEWVYGTTEFSVFNYHSGVQAAEMAVSMRVYPSGKIKP